MNAQTETTRNTTPTEAPKPQRAAPRHWITPQADLQEGKDGYRLVLDVPGVSNDRLSVQVHRGTLTVEGLRDDRVGYRRQFELSDLVDVNAVGAELKHGVLTLTLPRSRESQPRRIAVG